MALGVSSYKGKKLTWLHTYVVYLCRLLITFANSFYPDQARQNVEPDLDPKLFDTLMVFLKEIFKKVDFEKKNQQTTKSMQNYPEGKDFYAYAISTVISWAGPKYILRYRDKEVLLTPSGRIE